MDSDHLVAIAEQLVSQAGKQRPRQANLKRAISSLYYAMFHELCQNCANSFIGPSRKGKPAWVQAYRSVDHGFAKNQFMNAEIMEEFPQEIQNFAELFRSLQKRRHQADYNPQSRFTKNDILSEKTKTQLALKTFRSSLPTDRRAFAVWTSFRPRLQ